MVERLTGIASRDSRLVLGLMSGTSHDGVDVALARISGSGGSIKVEQAGYYERKYPGELRGRISDAFEGPAQLICSLNFELGRFFGETALDALESFGVGKEKLDLVGSHGQTVHHIPPAEGEPGSTLQIGEPAVIAGMLDTPVVSDFRAADMAEGGQGAPLTPYADWAFFRRPGETPVIANIGGVCNVTAVTERLDDVFGFDTGPGNSLIDEAASILSGGECDLDKDGKWAESGELNRDLLDMLLSNPYLDKNPPKSTGRETFGRKLAEDIIKSRSGVESRDMLCTLTHFTVESLAKGLEVHVFPRVGVGTVALCGGGARNRFMVKLLRDRLKTCNVVDTSSLGVDPDAREALAFAVLANEAVCGVPAGLVNVTGAARPRILGKISPV